jgi:hypothetical protein
VGSQQKLSRGRDENIVLRLHFPLFGGLVEKKLIFLPQKDIKKQKEKILRDRGNQS